MHNSVTACHQLLQGTGIAEVTLDQLHAQGDQGIGLVGAAHQRAYTPALGQQGGAKLGADEAGGAGYGN